MNTEITDNIGRRHAATDLLIAAVPLGVALILARAWPAWALMWAMALAVWMAFKWIMWRDVSEGEVRGWRRIGFFLGWAGTDAAPWRSSVAAAVSAAKLRAKAAETAATPALCRIALGAGLIWIGVRLTIGWNDLLAGWIGMIGSVLLLHFGLFDLIALAWRRAGIGVEPLMCRPAHARSVADFWNRWNRGFRDLAYRKVFRPLHRRIGLLGATFGAFLFSGLIHDLMISVPARSGYGLPTLYFLIQFLAVMAERIPVIRNLRPATHWLYTCLAVLGPLGMLFHADFVRNVYLPFLIAIGAT